MTQPAQNFKQNFSETIFGFSIQISFKKVNNIDFTIL